MPNSNTNSSPVKRPSLGRRAVSSHAVVTRSASTTGDSSDPKSHIVHRHHHPRPHLVGHRHNHHSRNPSYGKNVNKLQRLTSGAEPARHHQRKKSAPATPATSPPRGGPHVRWEEGGFEDPNPAASMKKNNSSPALRRYTSTGTFPNKKSIVSTDRPRSSSGKKKTVGFEIGDSENDDGEWEDTTQSPESTRRSSVAQSKESVENAAALVDPLIFVKRPYPQIPRATSLPEPTSQSFAREGQSTDEEEGQESQHEEKERQGLQEQQGLQRENKQQEAGQVPEPSAIASRLISPALSAKAPPAMSSISAMAKPAAIDTAISRTASLNNLKAGQDASRRTLPSPNPALASTPGNHTQATSSSIEGGVSRFIVNNGASRADSDPNTPSSFLPHYHLQTPPSPGTTIKPRSSPPSRPPGAEPPSRTQQKLWLQRTAALNTSPPDGHDTVPPSVMDGTFMASAHGRPGTGAYDAGRALVNGSARSGGPGHDNEAKQTRKAFEKTALELTVVRRFQSPTADSFSRLRSVIQETRGPERSNTSLGQPVKSAPALTLLSDGQQSCRGSGQASSPETRQPVGRRMRPSVSETDDSSANDSGDRPKSQHPSQRILSTSDDTATGNPSTDDDAEPNQYNDIEMMIRRMWDSRIVASSA